jgi:DNA-binding GntR family transcriptional regulator
MRKVQELDKSAQDTTRSISLISRKLIEKAAFSIRLSDRVHDYIVERIFENELAQGQKITESDIAKQLKISTAPVREAMIRLDQEGWIDRYPNRGACISNHTDAENYRQLYSLRLCLETGAFSHLAVTATNEQLAELERIVQDLEEGIASHQVTPYRQADTGFHLTVAEFAGGQRLKEMLSPVLMQTFVLVFSQDFSPIDESPTACHRALYEAIASHDPHKASKLISEHIQSQAVAHNMEI